MILKSKSSFFSIQTHRDGGLRDVDLLNSSQMALVELEIVNQFVDEVVRDRKITLSGMVGTLGEWVQLESSGNQGLHI